MLQIILVRLLGLLSHKVSQWDSLSHFVGAETTIAPVSAELIEAKET